MDVDDPDTGRLLSPQPGALNVNGRYNAAIVEIENQCRGALNMILAARGPQREWMLTGDKLIRREAD